jgi:hypothetical protein
MLSCLRIFENIYGFLNYVQAKVLCVREQVSECVEEVGERDFSCVGLISIIPSGNYAAAVSLSSCVCERQDNKVKEGVCVCVSGKHHFLLVM